ncbi:hypothetical protein MAPG_02456 [Magnaporthiopsis poae ATCC 64411]|uniref:Uncharacterized protein n=1 Tax=Magnaporthiopsis poae (strain ATCC 64411 / 73-15) TaxID=644358 RepID=A0A0C4DRE9_MAGP6|nr:hypothetical protein MAPG_02456 [Magnaporthiopsis poae ATCC 64411]
MDEKWRFLRKGEAASPPPPPPPYARPRGYKRDHLLAGRRPRQAVVICLVLLSLALSWPVMKGKGIWIAATAATAAVAQKHTSAPFEPFPDCPRPRKTLAAYTRLRGVPAGGGRAEADLAWTLGDIARHDENGNTVLYPGTYKVQIDEPVLATAEFTLTGEPVVLDKWPALPKPPNKGTRK